MAPGEGEGDGGGADGAEGAVAGADAGADGAEGAVAGAGADAGAGVDMAATSEPEIVPDHPAPPSPDVDQPNPERGFHDWIELDGPADLGQVRAGGAVDPDATEFVVLGP